jgi:glycosyltransferase involved in cell wall biosynthesis
MKKILIVLHETHLYGSVKSILGLIKQLRNHFQILIVVPNSEGDIIEELLKLKINYLEVNNISSLYSGNLLKRIFININLFFIFFKIYTKFKPQIIYLNTSVVRYAALPCIFVSSKIIWHIHEYYENAFLQIFILFLVRSIANETIVVSNYMKKHKGFKFAHVVHNGVEIKNETHLDKLGSKLVFVGRIKEEKGAQDLIMSLAEIKKIIAKKSVHLYGRCERIEYFSNLIKENKLDKIVQLRGFEKDIDSIYSDAYLFLLPSYRESFGISIIEAMANRIPVISTNIGGIPEIVTPDCGILVSPGDIKTLALSIKKLLNDEILALKMGKNGYEKVKKYFTMESFVNKIFNILTNI